LQTLILYKGASLDRTDTSSVNEFNNLFQKYRETVFPEISGAKEENDAKTIKDRLKKLEKLDMSKIKIKGNEDPLDIMKKSGKIKII